MSDNGVNGTAAKVLDYSNLPPHSDEAEQAVLGGIVIDPQAFYDVSDFLEPSDFYIGKNRIVYEAISDLTRQGVAIDLVTLTELLEMRGPTDRSYIIGLLNAVPTSINTRHYGRIVRSHSLRRKLSAAAGHINTLANDEAESIDAIIERSEAALFSVTGKASSKKIETIKSGMLKINELVLERMDGGGQIIGLPTGFVDLDKLLQGMEKDNLYVVAGRPGMGKSLLEGGVSLSLAKHGKRIARFNLEMPNEQIWMRLLSMESGIPLTRLKKGDLRQVEVPIFMEATGRLSELSMWVDDTAGLNMSQLTAKCRRLHAEHGLDLITIDYLQLMASDKHNYGNRTQEIGQISRGLKRLAKDLHVPVLALSQLSRACEMRADKRPLLSDLRDSGDIEQDSDVVIFIYRDEYYSDTTMKPNVAELNVAKHRNGPTGEVDLYFKKTVPMLTNLAPNEINL